MRVTNRQNFKSRLLIPVSIPLYAIGMYIGMFTNIFFREYPITFFVSMTIIATAVSLTNYNTEEISA